MNTILLEQDELRDDTAVLTGRRAQHVREVLDAQEGAELRVGVLGGQMGVARVTARSEESIRLEVHLASEPPPPSPATLVLALARPKVVRRVLVDVAAAGIKNIHLVGAWKVDKGYWGSPLLTEDAIRRHLILGLEQGGDTVVPTVTVHRLFRPFVEDTLPALAQGKRRLVAHPHTASVCPRGLDEPFVLVVGPERGFSEYEIACFTEAGFEAVSLGARVLRVEAAVATLLGRLG